MTELEKTGLLILFLVLIGVLNLGIAMIHDDLVKLGIKLENIVKGVEKRMDQNALTMNVPMNDPNNMKPICHNCPYWEVCEPPYDCYQTEKKYRSAQSPPKEEEHV